MIIFGNLQRNQRENHMTDIPVISLVSPEQREVLIKSLKTVTHDSPRTNTGGFPKVLIPGTTPELLTELRKMFPDKLPPMKDFADGREALMWRIYGQQDVLNWIQSRLEAQQRET